MCLIVYLSLSSSPDGSHFIFNHVIYQILQRRCPTYGWQFKEEEYKWATEFQGLLLFKYSAIVLKYTRLYKEHLYSSAVPKPERFI